MTLADLISLAPSSEAREAYEWLRKSGAPHTDINSLHYAPEFDITPRLEHK